MPKTLALCYRMLEKRTVRMSAELGSETIALEMSPAQTAEQYKEAIERFCARVADDHR